MKRKIHKSVKSNGKGGVSHYEYDINASRFFLDNKLKIVHRVTNRLIEIKKLYIGSEFLFAGDWKEIMPSSSSSNNSIQIKDLVNALWNNLNTIPNNIYTNDPIICELVVFILQNFVIDQMEREERERKQKIEVIYFVESVTKNHFLDSKNYIVKKRSCPLTPIKREETSSKVFSEETRDYYLQDQTLLFIDDNTNNAGSTKVVLNLPPYIIISNEEKFKSCEKRQDLETKRRNFFATHNGEIAKYFSTD